MKTFFIYLVLFACSFSLFAQSDEIIGKWKFTDSSREIKIYIENNKYYGKIVKTSGKNDKMKIGHIMLKDLVYDQTDKKYTGEVNSPSGMTASGEIVLIDENKLQINVQKFFIINKSYTLTRIK